MSFEQVDAVIVGGGIAGALTAQRLVEAGMKVVVLEAGADDNGLSDGGWERYLEHFHRNPFKTPNAPYPPNPSAPSPSVLDVGAPAESGYFHQRGPNPFRSNYTRALGGTTLHWLGTSLRLTPADFELYTRYGRGVDWPIAYDDLEPWYARAEWAIGVSGEVADQKMHGITFADGYQYPMAPIPISWLDRMLVERLRGKHFEIGEETISLEPTPTPQGRNSIPRTEPADVAGRRRLVYEPRGGSVEMVWRGQRCEGNSSCIPICPVKAKYSALKTLGETRERHPLLLDIRTQSVVSRLECDPDDGRVTSVVYKRYAGPGDRSFDERRIAGRIVVLAASAVENAKLGLASNLRDASNQLGRNLMDHPFVLSWGAADQAVGPFRGPGSTSGIETFRDGAFRAERAGFRAEIGNWGWNLAAGSPASDVVRMARGQGLRGEALRARLRSEVQRQVRLGAVTEQLPSPENRVTIRPDIRDALGEPRPVIDYHIDDYAFAGMALARDVFSAVFDHADIAEVTEDDPHNPGWVERDGRGLVYWGSGHLVGTHRMGADSTKGVTDDSCRAFGHPNLWMVGAGAMPTIGTCNPTLTLAALTLRAAEDMVAKAGALG